MSQHDQNNPSNPPSPPPNLHSSDYAPYPKLDPNDVAPPPENWGPAPINQSAATTMPSESNPYVSPTPVPNSSAKSTYLPLC